MADYSRDELESAQKALLASHRKIERVRETLLQKQNPPKSQLTLARRNLEALPVALTLIGEELDRHETKQS